MPDWRTEMSVPFRWQLPGPETSNCFRDTSLSLPVGLHFLSTYTPIVSCDPIEPQEVKEWPRDALFAQGHDSLSSALSLCCQLLPTPGLVVLSQVGCFCTPLGPALQLGKQNQLSRVFPRGSSSLCLSYWLSEELALWAEPLSLLSSFQPPQTWHSGKWAQGREEEISYLAVCPGDLLGGVEPPLPEGTQDVGSLVTCQRLVVIQTLCLPNLI